MVDVYCKFTDKYYATGKPEPQAQQVSSDQAS